MNKKVGKLFIKIMKKNIFVLILAFVLVAGAFFYAGIKYERKTSFTNRQNFQQVNNFRERQKMFGVNNVRLGGSFVVGEIINKDDKSITLKTKDGGSKIIFLSSQTEITKVVSGTSSDLISGKNIVVSGDTNSDGSLNAQMIQIRSN